MPDLAESLQGKDLGHLRIIAELWGIPLDEGDFKEMLASLVSAMSDPARVEKVVTGLPSDVKSILLELMAHSGKLPWAYFTRHYGELREMGVARRDREQPHKQPISAVEALWYRGLIAHAFMDAPAGPEEFAYIPDDLLKRLSTTGESPSTRMGRQAAKVEYARVYPANDIILDHACTLMAALRLGIILPGPFSTPAGEELTPVILAALLTASGLLDEAAMPSPESARIFLEADRGDALVQLMRSWQESTMFNELSFLPGLIFEGNWKNDPLRARQAILGNLALIPEGTWWSLGSFIAAIKQHNPDFQRPSGDYDSWFIRQRDSGQYLRGFEHWDDVDGRLLRFIITGPMYWLGLIDLASSADHQEVTAFRPSRWSQTLLKGASPSGMALEEQALVVRSDARITAGHLVPRWVRYQLARFCEWGKENPEEYHYQVSPASLVAARQQGLKVSQLVTLLNRHSKAVPPSVLRALDRWEKHGSEARLEKMVILRVTTAEILHVLQKSRAARFLGEPLGATTIAIKPGAAQKVLAVLAELGYLGELRGDAD